MLGCDSRGVVTDDADDPWGREPETLVVAGETFVVRPRPDGGYAYDWTTGPNPGYGFSVSRRFVAGDDREAVAAADAAERASPTPKTIEEHLHSIREFLDDVDPDTGYIE